MKFILNESDINDIENCVVYFYTPWMPYHKKMVNMLSFMEKKYNNLPFYAVDCDSFRSLPKKYDVEEVPTLLLINNNKRKKVTGLIMASALKTIFNDIFKIKPLKGDLHGKKS